MTNRYEEKEDFNRDRIQEELVHLSGGHWRIPMIERDYASFWRHVKEINAMFKELKPIRREDREELWSRFNSICEETKDKRDDEYQKREWRSGSIKEEILSDIHSAEVQDLFGFDPPGVDEMKRLSHVLKEARETLKEKRQEMLHNDRQECYDALKEVQQSHDIWWDDLKRHRSERREEFQQRLRCNLEKNRDKLEKANGALESCEKSADELRDKISSSWNDDWASKAEGWLSELESKIEDIKESIERLERWIEEDESKLD